LKDNSGFLFFILDSGPGFGPGAGGRVGQSYCGTGSKGWSCLRRSCSASRTWGQTKVNFFFNSEILKALDTNVGTQ